MASPYAGRQILIKVDTNGVGGTGANWVTIGAQRGGGLRRGHESADATSKSSSGWTEMVVTRKNWGVSCDGVLDPADTAIDFLETAFENMTKVYVQMDRSAISATSKEGKSIISDFSEEASEGDVYAFTCEFQGDGALSDTP
jgi:predicted secreted protein